MMLRATVVVLLLVLAGCSASPKVVERDPAYAPVIPERMVAPPSANGAIYQAGYDRPLFEDMRARRVGDTLTIQLLENTSARKQASTSTSKESGVSMAGPTLLGRPVTVNGVPVLSASVDGSTEFSGSGASQQSNSLTGNLTVTVVSVLPNGNLLVRGEKVLSLTQGHESVRVSGIVRPIDIRIDNTVLSTQLADAHITYESTGVLAEANTMGWLTRFFNSSWWPF